MGSSRINTKKMTEKQFEQQDALERLAGQHLHSKANFICVTSTDIYKMSIEQLDTLLNNLEWAQDIAETQLSKLIQKKTIRDA